MTFDEFIRAELAGLTRFAGALAGDRHLAEDVLSDALVTVAGRWQRVSRTAQPLAYVRRIVVRAYLSDRRTARRRRTEPTDDVGTLDRATADASESVARRDEVDRLLAHLAPKQRAALVLRYLLDQTDEQIAEALGCTPATVRSHLSHARSALRLVADAPVERS